ncbi:trace amine-associated receptor 1-like [Sebastes umbrosus]|uniref:trace amine-associated receptor 1-like n=1 Tax=Sebastes umbrosus TaxID=72105 RepID=UPI00189CADFA|nr:trace amine-associated receptor 1-like [Sebastes umbrosus]
MEERVGNSELEDLEKPVLCYESRNGSCQKTIYPLPVRITLYMILGVTVILTVCGNFLVAVSIAFFKQLRTPTNYLIASLAVSDLLLGLLVMFPSMIHSVESCWYFGDVLYRHYAVCQPLLYRRKISVNVVLIMILLIWSISALIGFGMIFLKLNIWGIEEFYYNHIACEGGCFLFQSRLSSTVSSVFSFYIPGIIMLGVYLKIFLVAQKQLHSIQNTSCMSSAKISNKSQTKATKTLAIIMGAFLSFWTPFFVCNTINPFISYSTPPVLFGALVWVGYLNSTVNPLIYAFFYSWFRKAFRLFTSDFEILIPAEGRNGPPFFTKEETTAFFFTSGCFPSAATRRTSPAVHQLTSIITARYCPSLRDAAGPINDDIHHYRFGEAIQDG